MNSVKFRLIVFGTLAVLLIVCSFFSEHLTPYDPYLQDLRIAKQPPSAEHLLGTDRYGRDMLSRVKVYRKMQMVFQPPTDSFDPRRTLGDGIGESLRNIGMSRKETREEVERLLGKCGLPADFADRYPHQVSGGQCQRAAIARALAVKPKLTILPGDHTTDFRIERALTTAAISEIQRFHTNGFSDFRASNFLNFHFTQGSFFKSTGILHEPW